MFTRVKKFFDSELSMNDLFGSFQSNFLAYLFILPQLVVIGIFFIYPTIKSFRMSMFRSVPFRGLVNFVGLKNFIDIFQSPAYLQSIVVTLIFGLLVTVLGVGVSLVIAKMLDVVVRGVGFYQAAVIWPYAISPTIAGIIWGFLFHPSHGSISYFLPFELNWLTNGEEALVLVILAATWRQLGYNIAFYIAGLKAIPTSFQEAAVVDGANGWQRFWRITFPMLSPITFFLVTMNLIYAFFRTFGLIHALTQGGPAGYTNLMIYKVYTDGFTDLRLGYSAAQSVILLLFVAGITMFQFKFAERRVAYQ